MNNFIWFLILVFISFIPAIVYLIHTKIKIYRDYGPIRINGMKSFIIRCKSSEYFRWINSDLFFFRPLTRLRDDVIETMIHRYGIESIVIINKLITNSEIRFVEEINYSKSVFEKGKARGMAERTDAIMSLLKIQRSFIIYVSISAARKIEENGYRYIVNLLAHEYIHHYLRETQGDFNASHNNDIWKQKNGEKNGI